MRTLKSRTAVTLTTGALALAGILGTAGTANAAPTPTPAPAPQTQQVGEAGQVQPLATYSRKVWKTVNLRTGPSRSYAIIGKLYGGTYYTVSCWKYGETVTAEGTTNNVWIRAYTNGRWGYASAIYFSGNKYGNLPSSARC
ncbi:SH3 domain-containing protein [Streptomyces sp. R302]|uniref:SH3 domain-containing protein n=1 Tax=unclassified Streptomyces TaxID=2593676 RepID=UPI00145D257C|nr:MULTISPECIES: SH3 domain-containing protein [unclassified Streptomyces]NML48887.1 SH3 domain-containing protein [Streptomyces sp. R301]NML77214.1 SH3 domain-containing protein [Streptomyces sp. R302]